MARKSQNSAGEKEGYPSESKTDLCQIAIHILSTTSQLNCTLLRMGYIDKRILTTFHMQSLISWVVEGCREIELACFQFWLGKNSKKMVSRSNLGCCCCFFQVFCSGSRLLGDSKLYQSAFGVTISIRCTNQHTLAQPCQNVPWRRHIPIGVPCQNNPQRYDVPICTKTRNVLTGIEPRPPNCRQNGAPNSGIFLAF